MSTKAPRPGSGRALPAEQREKIDEAATAELRIRVRDKTLVFSPALSIAERGQVRKQTGGLAFETYWNGETSIGLDSLQVMWWLARRANGEPTLLLRTVEETWPGDLTEDDLDVEEIIPDDDETADDPES